MFERYTEKARRVIFFARYEACQYGSPYIESDHLLLGLLREDQAIANRFSSLGASIKSIRAEIETHFEIRARISPSVQVPLTQECKRILTLAAEEAVRLDNRYVGTEHLLLGILHEEKSSAAKVLRGAGLELLSLREEIAGSAPESDQIPLRRPPDKGVEVGRALDDFLEAWANRDAMKLASFFDQEARFFDPSAELWIGRAEVEKAIDRHFSASGDSDREADVRDVKFIRLGLVAVTIVCGSIPEAQQSPSREFLMTLILTHSSSAWRIVSATLARIQPPPANAQAAP